MNSTETNYDRWQRLKEVFSEAIELAPEQRRAYLSALHLNEQTLSEELVELIASEEESENFLKKPLEVNFNSPVAGSYIGTKIGHYKIVSEIGRGVMGAAFEAVRQRKNADNDRDLILYEIPMLDIKQEILTKQGKADAALKEMKTGLNLAEEFHRLDSSNTEAIEFIRNFSAAARLLHNQGKEKEAEKYRQMFLKVEKEYKEKFGKNWEFKL